MQQTHRINGASHPSIHRITVRLDMTMPVKMHVVNLGPSSAYRIDFDVRLQRRGSDIKLFANQTYTPAAGDSEFLAAILTSLINGESGVESLSVTPYTLGLTVSTAISIDDIVDRIKAAAARTQRTLVAV